MANKIKASMRIRQTTNGIICVVSRYISGHSRPFRQVTESSQGRIERMLNMTDHSIHIEFGEIVLVCLSYCKAEIRHAH